MFTIFAVRRSEGPRMATLLACAIRIGQGSLSHLMPVEETPCRAGVITREVARRLREVRPASSNRARGAELILYLLSPARRAS